MQKKISTIFIATALILLPAIASAQVTLRTENREKLAFTMNAGETLTHTITVANVQKNPIDVLLYATDGTLTNTGGFAVTTKTSPQVAVGKWIHFNEANLHLEPKEEKKVNFTINVPSDATPGSYGGGLSVEPNTSKTSSSQGQTGTGATTSTRVAIPIYVTVSGEKITNYSWEDFSHKFDKKHIFSIVLVNKGNTILQAKGTITIEDSLGNKSTIPLNNLSLLRDSTNPAQVQWDQTPYFGFFNASANLVFSEFDPMSHSFKKVNELTKTITFTIIPWGIIGLVLLSIMTIFAYFLEKNLAFKKLLKSCREYTVNENDTLDSIAKANSTTWEKLAKINKLAAPYTITHGQKILVPPEKKV